MLEAYIKAKYEYDPRGWVTLVGSWRPLGNRDRDGYFYITIRYRKYKLHHLVWFMHHNEWPKRLDHINRHRSDNRIENLRKATAVQDGQNRTNFKGGIHRMGNLWFIQLKGWKGRGYRLYCEAYKRRRELYSKM